MIDIELVIELLNSLKNSMPTIYKHIMEQTMDHIIEVYIFEELNNDIIITRT